MLRVAPAPTRFTVCGGANYLTTIVKNTKGFMFFCGIANVVAL
jgi:hypothetical protein